MPLLSNPAETLWDPPGLISATNINAITPHTGTSTAPSLPDSWPGSRGLHALG
jgi:hypothetical protein